MTDNNLIICVIIIFLGFGLKSIYKNTHHLTVINLGFGYYNGYKMCLGEILSYVTVCSCILSIDEMVNNMRVVYWIKSVVWRGPTR